MADIVIENHGSVALLRGDTEAGREWIADNVQYEDWQLMGGSIACEPRMLRVVAEGAAADGLTVQS